MLPPELHEPFASSQERTLVVRELLDLCGDIDELQQLAARPVNQWPLGQLHRFAAPMASRAEDPARWLAQWRTLFADELAQVHAARDAAIHRQISDAELRTARYLAGQLLSWAYGHAP
jgi:hypothetical protein